MGAGKDRGWEIPWWRLGLGAAALAALFTGYLQQLRVHLPRADGSPSDGAWVVLLSAALAFFTFLALLGLVLVGQALHQRFRLAAFAAGAPLRDGAYAAMEGHAQAEGGLLEAPFSGERCLAYEYEVWVRADRPLRGRHEHVIGETPGPQRTHLVGVSGIALAPTVIVGRHGRARLLGWSPLEQGFPSDWFYPAQDPALARKVRTLLEQRRFEAVSLSRALAFLGRLFGLQASAAPPLQQDWRFDERVLGAKPENLRVRERRLPADSYVGACGLWSAARGGVHGRVGVTGLELWAGPLAEKRRQVLRQPLTTFGFSLLLALALHGAVALLWRSDAQLEALARERQAAGFERAWQERDLPGVVAALKAGAPVERRDHYGNTLLISAAWERDLTWVEALLAAGASVHPSNSAYGRNYTALAAAVMRGREDVVSRLVAAGAVDFRVTERDGRPLTGASDPPLAAVAAYYQAIADGDRAALERLRLDPLDPSPIDWDLWRRVRPFAPGRARGYWSDRAATLTLTAPDAHGRETRWAYQLACVPAAGGACEWKVEFEWEVRG